MKVTIDGLVVDGTEDEILRLINLMRQNGSKPTEPAVKVEKKPHRWAKRRLGPREAEVLGILRTLHPDGVRSPDLAKLVPWGDNVKDEESAAVSRTSQTLCNLQKKKLVRRPIGSSVWELTEIGLNCPVEVRGKA